MKRFLIALLLLICFGCHAKDKIIEDTTIVVKPDIDRGIIWYQSQESIDSIKILGILKDVVFQQIAQPNWIEVPMLKKGYYYIVFKTHTNKELTQKLFYIKDSN